MQFRVDPEDKFTFRPIGSSHRPIFFDSVSRTAPFFDKIRTPKIVAVNSRATAGRTEYLFEKRVGGMRDTVRYNNSYMGYLDFPVDALQAYWCQRYDKFYISILEETVTPPKPTAVPIHTTVGLSDGVFTPTNISRIGEQITFDLGPRKNVVVSALELTVLAAAKEKPEDVQWDCFANGISSSANSSSETVLAILCVTNDAEFTAMKKRFPEVTSWHEPSGPKCYMIYRTKSGTMHSLQHDAAGYYVKMRGIK